MTWQLARKTCLTNVFAGALSLASLNATAADNDWHYGATLYLWGAGIQGETVGGADIDVGFDTLISNLNMAFMGAFEARQAHWSFLADVIYLNVGVDDGGTVPVRLQSGETVGVNIKAGVETKGWVLNLLGAYTVLANEQASLDVLAGARYLDLEVDFDLGLAAEGYGGSRSLSASGDVWDGVVGVKGRVNLNDRWYLPYYVDVGTGQSDLTWQAFGGVGYSFDWGEMSVVYRHIEWELDSDRGLDNINFSGPAAAVTWRF